MELLPAQLEGFHIIRAFLVTVRSEGTISFELTAGDPFCHGLINLFSSFDESLLKVRVIRENIVFEVAQTFGDFPEVIKTINNVRGSSQWKETLLYIRV